MGASKAALWCRSHGAKQHTLNKSARVPVPLGRDGRFLLDHRRRRGHIHQGRVRLVAQDAHQGGDRLMTGLTPVVLSRAATVETTTG